MQQKLLKVLKISLVGIILSGCMGVPNVLNPRSAVSTSEANLYMIVLGIAAVVFVIVEGGLIY